MESFSPDWYSAPGESITELLYQQKHGLKAFSQRMGMSESESLALLDGQTPIDDEIAARISAFLGGTKDFWLTRERHYQEDMERIRKEQNVSSETFLKNLPINNMVELGWLSKSDARNPNALFALFGVRDVMHWRKLMSQSLGTSEFRQSRSFKSNPTKVFAWLRMCELDAYGTECKEWDEKAFRNLLPEIRTLTKRKEPEKFVPELQSICREAGVAVIVRQAPKGCGVSGATRFLPGNKAMIALTFRFLTDDQFWFSFFHEAGHLLLHNPRTPILEGELESRVKEAEADEFAALTLIPLQYQNRLSSLRSNAKDIIRFAVRVGVSPGIVVGQLQHMGILGYNQQRRLKKRYAWS